MHAPVPRTSVIICTRNRPESFQRALASVLAQDTDGFEVIVVDGSDHPVMLPEHAPAPLRLLGGQQGGEGRARAAGMRLAEGELIAWCDDDDEWSSEHLRVLRQELLAHPEVGLVCAAGERDKPPQVMIGRQGRRQPSPPAPEGFSLAGGDVLHRAEAARAVGGFDASLRAHAAGDLWSRMFVVGGWRRVERTLTTHHRVPSPTAAEARSRALRRVGRVWVEDRQRQDRSAARVRARESGLVPFDSATWSNGRRELIFETIIEESISFSIVARELIGSLQAHGVQVTTSRPHNKPTPPEWEGIAAQTIEPRTRLALIYQPPSDLAALACERVVRYAMWETTVIPAEQVREINQTVSMLYVPCQENARIARANGITVPARVLHHGVNLQRFPLLDRTRSHSEPFVFGCHAVLQHRKGTDLLIRAFLEEFAPNEPARLALKHTLDRCHDYAPRDPRITLTTGFIGHAALLEFLRGLDAFVLPSRGEGFGLTGLEALATGLPLISTNWSGPAEYLDQADTYPLRYELKDTGGLWFGFRRHFGLWAEPDIGHLRQLMRHVYEHREEAAAKGRAAAARVQRDWTWDRVARQFIADFDLLAQGVTPEPA